MKFRLVFFGPDDDPAKQIPEFVDSAKETTHSFPGCLYQTEGTNLIRRVPSADGSCKSVIIANFHAQIVHDILIDDGVRRTRHFVVRAFLGTQTLVLELPA